MLFISLRGYSLTCAFSCFGALLAATAIELDKWISEYNRQCIWTWLLNHVTYTAWHYSFSLWAQTSRHLLLLTVESVVSPSACIFKQTEVDRQLIRNGCVSLRDSEHNQKVQQVIKEHVTCLLSQCNCYATPILGYWVKKMFCSRAVIRERLVNFSSDLGNYDPDPIWRGQRSQQGSHSSGLTQCLLFVESGPLFP